MDSCVYCQAPLSPGPPWAPGEGHRLAYDPRKGRLWGVCTSCGRWNLTPLEDRWESLETCERAVRSNGRTILATPHLSLMDVGDGELIRVGEPARTEFVDWRYGARLPENVTRKGFFARLLDGLPPPPVTGYDPYGQVLRADTSGRWLASPFLEFASPLSYLFSQVPLAPRCPSCGRPLALEPWTFQDIRFAHGAGLIQLLAPCGFCMEGVEVPLQLARPALRLGIGLVTRPPALREVALRAAARVEADGGAWGLVDGLATHDVTVGELGLLDRAGLLISLDELAEAEALEAKWREAEELAAIADGELTRVPGFEEFRKGILDPGG